MALLHVIDGDIPADTTLCAALAGLRPGAPVVILLHGYRYCPHSQMHDPARLIHSLSSGRTSATRISWPRHLGLAGAGGLAIGYGWPARGSIWAAHARAAQAGTGLAMLIGALRRIAPERPVHLFAHSLGARVGLAALHHLPRGALDRAILIAPAVFRAEAAQALATSAGLGAEVVHVAGRHNRAFDLLLRAALPLNGATVGRGLPGVANWLDLPLDDATALAGLARLGHRIAQGRLRVCHWSGYLRPGVWPLYRALLHRPRETPLPVLRAAISAPAGRPGPAAPAYSWVSSSIR